jgi:hypothetical protein
MMRPERTAVVAAVVLAFVAIAAVGVWNHEMWRDELEIWLIARDSGSLPELLRNMGTQGHPALWYLTIWLVARVTSNPLGMQCLSVLIGAASVWIVYRHAPFPRLQRTLLCFGYFSLYEYTVISRNYGLEFLLLWACCAFYPRRRERPLALGTLLLLLSQTHLFGTVLAVGILSLMVLEALSDRSAREALRRPAVLGGLGLALAGAVLAALHVALQASGIGSAHLGVYQPRYDLPWLGSCLATVARGFVPLPAPGDPGLWNSNLLDQLPHPAGALVGGLLGALLLALCVLVLRRRPALLAAFLVVVGSMLAVFAVIWYGFARHHGQIFMAFVAFAWLSADLSPPRDEAATGPGGRARRMASTGLTVLLGIHVFAAGVLLVSDAVRPFSNARAAARFIAAEIDGETLRVGSRDYAVQPVTAWIDGPFFYPESGVFGTFLHWGPERRLNSAQEALQAAETLHGQEGRPVLLVLTFGPGELEPGQERSLPSGTRIRHVARFEGAMVPSENYWLYLLH